MKSGVLILKVLQKHFMMQPRKGPFSLSIQLFFYSASCLEVLFIPIGNLYFLVKGYMIRGGPLIKSGARLGTNQKYLIRG